MLTTDTDEVLVGTTSDTILISMIASYVKFVKMDKSKIVELPIKEVIDNNHVKLD